MTLSISNTREMPLGLLTPEYQTKIGDHKSVMNYVYSSIIKDISTTLELKNCDPGKIVSEFKFKKIECIKKELSQAAYIAGKTKMHTSADFKTALYTLGKPDSHISIVYVSPSIYVGVNGISESNQHLTSYNYISENGNHVTLAGYNIWGSVLTSLKKEMVPLSDDPTEDDKYNMYRAQKMAEKVLHYESLDAYISKDADRSIPKLIDMFKKNYSSEQLGERTFSSKETFMKTWRNHYIYLHKDPNDIIKQVRKQYINQIIRNNKSTLEVELFDKFYEKTILNAVNMTHEQKIEAIQLKNEGYIHMDTKRELIAKCAQQYEARLLHPDLLEFGDMLSKKLYFPTEDEKRRFMFEQSNKQFVINSYKNQEDEVFIINYNEKKTYPILHPESKDSVFIIDNRKFNSISQYMTFRVMNMFYMTANEKVKYEQRFEEIKNSDHKEYSKLLADVLDDIGSRVDILFKQAAKQHISTPEVSDCVMMINALPWFNIESKQINNYKHYLLGALDGLSNNDKLKLQQRSNVDVLSIRDFMQTNKYITVFLMQTGLSEFMYLFNNIKSCIETRLMIEISDLQIINGMKSCGIWFDSTIVEDGDDYNLNYKHILEGLNPECHNIVTTHLIRKYISFITLKPNLNVKSILFDIINGIANKLKTLEKQIINERFSTNNSVSITTCLFISALTAIKSLYETIKANQGVENYSFVYGDVHTEANAIGNFIYGRNQDGFKPVNVDFLEADPADFIDDEEIFGSAYVEEELIKSHIYKNNLVDVNYISNETVTNMARTVGNWANKTADIGPNLLLQCALNFKNVF